ncbi:hypothetical protein DFH08DRAFT_953882 [Mycena albidolilacea]|uniref:Uncharacterized protein n=1 Tax=Mycena albidolilacea TaxID=1033008 RepID=A0AAD7AFH0_9AGAR|nr:hypothetical protein DFH08DRAFT_953882 [Mycena albidolilacea]
MSKVTIADIRRDLNLSGAQNDQRWSDLCADVRRYMDAGLLDLSIGWKEQDNCCLAKVYDACYAQWNGTPSSNSLPQLFALTSTSWQQFQACD